MPTARELLEQADALMRRNRALATDDIPVLTDSVSLPAGGGVGSAARPSTPAVPAPDTLAAPGSIPTLVDSVGTGSVKADDSIPYEGEPSDWLASDAGEPSITGDAPDSIAIVPHLSVARTADEALIESAEHEEIELTAPLDDDFDALTATPSPPPDADGAIPATFAPPDGAVWDGSSVPEQAPAVAVTRMPDSAVSTAREVETPAAHDAEMPAAREAETPIARDAEMPVAREVEMPAAQDAEIPAAHDAEMPVAHEVEMPAAQDAEIPAAHDAEMPAAREVEMPAAQDAEIPAAHEAEMPTTQVPELGSEPETELSIRTEPGPEREPEPGPEPEPEPEPAVEVMHSALAASSAGVSEVHAPVPPALAIPSADDNARWEAVAEEIRMQVLQRIDLFTDTGLREQLGRRLQPIVDRASADLVATINQHVGELLRAYVAEAIEREIESWRKNN
jgi:hypothetical protein